MSVGETCEFIRGQQKLPAGSDSRPEVAKAYGMPARIVERAKQSLIYRPQ
jgi:hypothetical protein